MTASPAVPTPCGGPLWVDCMRPRRTEAAVEATGAWRQRSNRRLTPAPQTFVAGFAVEPKVSFMAYTGSSPAGVRWLLSLLNSLWSFP